MLLSPFKNLRLTLVRTEENMKTAFRFWDGDLQEIASKRPDFYSCLLLEFQEALLKQNSLEPDSDTRKMAIHMWMEHLLVSPLWSQRNSAVDVQELYDQLMDACLISPNSWTQKLSKLLL